MSGSTSFIPDAYAAVRKVLSDYGRARSGTSAGTGAYVRNSGQQPWESIPRGQGAMWMRNARPGSSLPGGAPPAGAGGLPAVRPEGAPPATALDAARELSGGGGSLVPAGASNAPATFAERFGAAPNQGIVPRPGSSVGGAAPGVPGNGPINGEFSPGMNLPPPAGRVPGPTGQAAGPNPTMPPQVPNAPNMPRPPFQMPSFGQMGNAALAGGTALAVGSALTGADNHAGSDWSGGQPVGPNQPYGPPMPQGGGVPTPRPRPANLSGGLPQRPMPAPAPQQPPQQQAPQQYQDPGSFNGLGIGPAGSGTSDPSFAQLKAKYPWMFPNG